MLSMSKTARVLDCDGTIIRKLENKTLLELFLLEYCKSRPFLEKTDLYFRATLIKSASAVLKSINKAFFGNSYYITGETNLLRLCDLLYIRKAKIPCSFIEQFAAKHTHFLSPRIRQAISSCKDDLYIVTAEPRQLIEEVLKQTNLHNFVKDIYGTSFEIKNGEIVGFDKLWLYAGVRGKHIGLEKILAKGYDKIYAIGDSVADIGLFSHESQKVLPFTFDDSPAELRNYVVKNGGYVVHTLDEFFTYV